MKNRFETALIFLITTGTILGIHSSLLATQQQHTTNITHNPVDSINSGQRLFLSATVKDHNKVDTVRVYFKDQDSLDYNFIALRNDVRSKYVGVLPAAASDCKAFDYLILVKNGNNRLVISQIYTVKVRDNNISVPPSLNKVHIYTELTDAKEKIPGFFDNFSIDIVKDSLKYGAMAGLYGKKSTAASTTFEGKVVATPSTSGISTTALAAGGATVISIAIGGFAINYSSSGTHISTSANSSCPYRGKWFGTWQETRCDSFQTSGPWSGSVDDNCYFTGSKGNFEGSIDPTTGEAPVLGGTQIISCDSVERQVPNTTSRAVFHENGVNGFYTAEQVSGTFTGTKQ